MTEIRWYEEGKPHMRIKENKGVTWLSYVKASGLLFDDFRGGKIGRVTLEWAEQEKSE